ncbi:MAG: hypothetical protein ACOH2M_12770 [Cypionkella sp.]
MRIAVSLAALLLLTVPAFAAEATTYKGTLNGSPIIVELTDLSDGPVIGRYSYLAHGVDIPLQAAGSNANGSHVVLSEEAPCAPGLCLVDENYTVTSWPLAATWTLDVAANGTLTGTWQAEGKSSPLAIALKKAGQRTLPDDAEHSVLTLHESVFEQAYSSDTVFSAETAPYDALKMAVTLKQGPVQELQGSHFRYVTDPRTQFAYPRLLDLADGSDVGPANAALAAAHARVNLSAFDCLSQIYAGFGGRDDMLENGIGTLAGYEDETVLMTYLSPTLTTWTESGSTFCAGAYPNNHDNVSMVDTQTGDTFQLSRVFKDWTALSNRRDYGAPVDQAAALAAPQDYTWGAGQALIDYAIAHRTTDDPSYEDDCGMDELIASNLGFRFLPDDSVVFTLEDLPHVVFACGADLLTVKLADIPELLAPTASEVFPSLK